MDLPDNPRQSLALAEHSIKTLPQISKSLLLSLPFFLHFCERVEAFGTRHNKSSVFTMFSQNKERTVLDKWSLRNTAPLCHYKTWFKIMVFAKAKSASVSTWWSHMRGSPGAELHSIEAQKGERNNTLSSVVQVWSDLKVLRETYFETLAAWN